MDGQPLLRNAGQQAAKCIVSYLCQNASIRAQATRFLSESQPHGPHLKRIHVLQGEYAVVNTLQERHQVCLSSSEATTCCIVVLNCNITGLCGIAHFGHVQKHQKNCLSPLLNGLIAPELYIVGGFCEQTSSGITTANRLLGILEDSKAHVSIQLACIGDVNTTPDKAPKCRSLALTRSAESGCVPSNTTANDKGPAAVQRLARVFAPSASEHLENVYDTARQLMRVASVNSSLSRQHVSFYAAILQLPDTDLLNHMSTSPLHEAPSFVPGDALCDVHTTHPRSVLHASHSHSCNDLLPVLSGVCSILLHVPFHYELYRAVLRLSQSKVLLPQAGASRAMLKQAHSELCSRCAACLQTREQPLPGFYEMQPVAPQHLLMSVHITNGTMVGRS